MAVIAVAARRAVSWVATETCCRLLWSFCVCVCGASVSSSVHRVEAYMVQFLWCTRYPDSEESTLVHTQMDWSVITNKTPGGLSRSDDALNWIKMLLLRCVRAVHCATAISRYNYDWMHVSLSDETMYWDKACKQCLHSREFIGVYCSSGGSIFHCPAWLYASHTKPHINVSMHQCVYNPFNCT